MSRCPLTNYHTRLTMRRRGTFRYIYSIRCIRFSTSLVIVTKYILIIFLFVSEPSSPTVKSSPQFENNVSNSPETEMISPEDNNRTEHSDNNHNICRKTKANNSFINKTPSKQRKISKDESPSSDNKTNEKSFKTKKKQFASGLAIPALVRIHVVRNNSTKNISDKKPCHVPKESDAIKTKDFVTSAISIDSSVTSAKDIDISTIDSENSEQQPQPRDRLQPVDNVPATSANATHIQDETGQSLSSLCTLIWSMGAFRCSANTPFKSLRRRRHVLRYKSRCEREIIIGAEELH